MASPTSVAPSSPLRSSSSRSVLEDMVKDSKFYGVLAGVDSFDSQGDISVSELFGDEPALREELDRVEEGRLLREETNDAKLVEKGKVTLTGNIAMENVINRLTDDDQQQPFRKAKTEQDVLHLWNDVCRHIPKSRDLAAMATLVMCSRDCVPGAIIGKQYAQEGQSMELDFNDTISLLALAANCSTDLLVPPGDTLLGEELDTWNKLIAVSKDLTVMSPSATVIDECVATVCDTFVRFARIDFWSWSSLELAQFIYAVLKISVDRKFNPVGKEYSADLLEKVLLSISDDQLTETIEQLSAVFLSIGEKGGDQLCSVACAAQVLGSTDCGKRTDDILIACCTAVLKSQSEIYDLPSDISPMGALVYTFSGLSNDSQFCDDPQDMWAVVSLLNEALRHELLMTSSVDEMNDLLAVLRRFGDKLRASGYLDDVVIERSVKNLMEHLQLIRETKARPNPTTIPAVQSEAGLVDLTD